MNLTTHWRRFALATTMVLCSAIPATQALATNGYMANGYGGGSKGMAGAGVAIPTGVLGLAQNPAMGLKVGNKAGFCLTTFAPDRGADIPAGGSLVPGSYTSENPVFFIPCGGVNLKFNETSAIAAFVFGNGGMNTEYSTTPFGFFPGSTTPLGVNLEQLFLTVNYTHALSPTLTFGISPILAVQRFSATGLGGFAPFSANPAALTDNGDDWSTGFGFNLGVLYEPNDALSFGLAYRSKFDMDEFDRYAGLFAEGGDFDIPPVATLGVAWKLPTDPRLTLTAEYQRIFYGSVPALANSSTTLAPGSLGTATGPGFGWEDMDVLRLGFLFKKDDRLTLRGGISHATGFTQPQEALMNILAPATPQWHVSVGATYRLNEKWSITGSYTHAFSNSLTGTNPAVMGSQPVTIHMNQHEFAIGAVYSW